MVKYISAYASGLLLGGGLVVARLWSPQVILGALDYFGEWDPTLFIALTAAVIVVAPVHAWAKKRLHKPLAEPAFSPPPPSNQIDTRLVLGASLFAASWGLLGLCPGAAVVALGAASVPAITYVAALSVGMLIPGFFRQRSGQRLRGVQTVVEVP